MTNISAAVTHSLKVLRHFFNDPSVLVIYSSLNDNGGLGIEPFLCFTIDGHFQGCKLFGAKQYINVRDNIDGMNRGIAYLVIEAMDYCRTNSIANLTTDGKLMLSRLTDAYYKQLYAREMKDYGFKPVYEYISSKFGGNDTTAEGANIGNSRAKNMADAEVLSKALSVVLSNSTPAA